METYKRIYKYPLDVSDTPGRRLIEVDCLSVTPLSVAEQRGDLMLWAVVEEGNDERTLTLDIAIVGTGHMLWYGMLHEKRFIGSVPMSTGFVWHVYASDGTVLDTVSLR